MLIRLFKSNHAIFAAIIPLIATLLCISYIWYETDFYTASNSVLTAEFFKDLKLSRWITIIISIIAISLIGIYLNFRVESYKILRKSSYLPALFFVLTSSSLPHFVGFYQGYISLIFLLTGLENIFALSESEKVSSHIFNASFLISIGSLFYPPLIGFELIVLIGIIAHKKVALRELIITVVGSILPYLFTLVVCFASDRSYLVIKHFSEIPDGNWPQFEYLSNYFFISIWVLLLLLGIMPLLKEINQNKVRVSKNLIITAFLLIITLLLPVLFPHFGLSVCIFIAIPLSVYLANFFNSLKIPLLAEFLFFILFLTVIINHTNYTAF